MRRGKVLLMCLEVLEEVVGHAFHVFVHFEVGGLGRELGRRNMCTGDQQSRRELRLRVGVKVTFGCTRVALVKCLPQDNLGLLSP